MKLENWSTEYINDLVKNANNRNIKKFEKYFSISIFRCGC